MKRSTSVILRPGVPQVLLALSIILSAAEAIPAWADPAHCDGNANGVLNLTANGTLTFVTNTGQQVVHTKFSNFFATISIDLAPGETKPIAINGQGFGFSGCQANF